MTGLRIEGLTKQMPGFELCADLALARTERAALVSPSGSGKSTLLRLIAGLETPDGGSVHLNDRRISELPAEARRIGFVFQSSALFPSMTVLDNVTFALRLRGTAAREREERGREWLSRVGLAGFADRRIDGLSGGERQRVAFLRALIWGPELLLLDEPFSAVDASMKNRLKEELLRLLSENPVPVILVTHDKQDAREFASVRLGIEVQGSRHRVKVVIP